MLARLLRLAPRCDREMGSLGISLPLDGFSLAECIELAQHVERLGYTDVWTSEIGGADGLTLLAAIAARTEALRLGVGVLPAFSRPPALIAMSAAALDSLSNGRFCLGLGSSTEIVISDWMGLAFDRPLTRVREMVEAVQLAMSGSRVSYDGETVQFREFRLQMPPPGLVPVLIGALGPRMLALAGEVADGVVLSHVGLPSVASVLAPFWSAAEESGRGPADMEVVQRLGVAVEEDEEALQRALRRELAGYGRSIPYRASFARQGYTEEADAMAAAWATGDAQAASAAVSERMLRDLYIYGTQDECRARVAAFRAAGVRTPVILPISVHADAEGRKQRRVHVLEALAAAA